jgi:hypothetical protein
MRRFDSGAKLDGSCEARLFAIDRPLRGSRHHDAAALAILVLASTPINASDSMIFRPGAG